MKDGRNGGAVIPLIEFSSCRPALASTVRVRALAEHAGQFEDGMAVLAELDQRWGPGGELAALADANRGEPIEVSWETLLLLNLCDNSDEVLLNTEAGTATRLRTLSRPSDDLCHRLAAQLLAQELQDAGCVAVEVTVDARSAVDSAAGEASAEGPELARADAPSTARRGDGSGGPAPDVSRP